MHLLNQTIRNYNHANLISTTDQFITPQQKLNHMFAAASSGALSRVTTQPFDVLKIRFQLQVHPINQQLCKYQNIPQAIKLICREEGITALWKGHAPGQLLSIVYGISQFCTFEQLKLISHDIPILCNHPNIQHFLCGSICGAVASFVTAPMDIIKTRLIAQDKYDTAGYKNAKDAFIKIIRYEGPSGLYRGLASGLYQIVPYMGWNFMFYSFFGDIVANLMKANERNSLPTWCLLASGGISGVISKTIVYPFDLIQMRLQIQGCELQDKKFGTHFKCKGVWNCLLWLLRAEGYRSLFKGITPSLIKACLASSLNFCFYDKILSILK